MPEELMNLKYGTRIIFDRNIDNYFKRSLFISTQKLPEPEAKEKTTEKNIFDEYFELINFPLLFGFIHKVFKSRTTWGFTFQHKNFSYGVLAVTCLIVAFLSLISTLLPLTVAKVNSLNQHQSAEEIEKVNRQRGQEREAQLKQYEIDPAKEQGMPKDFKLFIPKIGLVSDISPSVDLENEEDYKKQLLTTGVAHAKGSYFPGQKGSVFLFAHSTDTIFNIARFNAKFFSLGELKNGDEILITYLGKDYKYLVIDRQVINPEQVDLIRDAGDDLILMTCTPPGTDWQRLTIFARQQPIDS